jgi:hypothetical protein
MISAHALTRQTCLVLPEYCLYSKVVLQYQYQGSSIVLQYKTARLVHPCSGAVLSDTFLLSCSGQLATKFLNLIITFKVYAHRMHKTAQISSTCTRVTSRSGSTRAQGHWPSVGPSALPSSGCYTLFFYCRPQPRANRS